MPMGRGCAGARAARAERGFEPRAEFGMGTRMRFEVGKGGGGVIGRRWWRALSILAAGAWACGGQDETVVSSSAISPGEPSDGAGLGDATFLGLPLTAADSASSPARLSETAAFIDVERLQVAPGILPYSVQSPLWSDGAGKRRWMALPSGASIGFSEQGAWALPEGTVFIKHFGMVLDERSPEDVRRLETRFLVAARGGEYYGLVYEWDDDQRDARLLLDGGEEVLEIVGADGSVREQRYTYPNQRACGSCHSARAGFVIGVHTAQLDGEYHLGAGEPAAAEGVPSGNQLEAWAELGLFDASFEESLDGASERGRMAPLDDESASLELRVRSYWDSNCSSCHNDASTLLSWDARFSTPLEMQGVLSAAPQSAGAAFDVRLIVPGDPERSLLYLRSRSDQPGTRMPPLLRNRVDGAYVALLREWIESLPVE